jgi:hypothetical protein
LAPAGRLADSIALFESVLADRRRELGPRDPDTLATRHNLAFAYQSAGRLADSITVFKSVLAQLVI